MIIRKSDIVQTLDKLPLVSGDCVMLHSSLNSLGQVEGGADAVIDAFLEVIGSVGSLVMPTLCQRNGDRRFETWDIKTSPSDVGRITEVFRRRRSVLRSDHATHSVAALGPLALLITQGHKIATGRPGPWGGAAFGIASPYEKLSEFDAKIVLLGVDFMRNTLVHFIEHLMVEKTLQHAPIKQRAAKAGELRGWNREGIWPNFDRLKLQNELEERHLIGRAICGKGTLLMCQARQTVDLAMEWMETNPAAWFDNEFVIWMKKSHI